VAFGEGDFVSFTYLARGWLVLGSMLVGSLGLMHCSSSDAPSSGGDAGSDGIGGAKGGSVSVAGSSSAGKGGASAGGTGAANAVGNGGSNAGKPSAGGGGTGGTTATPECKVEGDCGAGQMCNGDGKCVVKACTPPPTAFQFTPAVTATTVSLAGTLNAWSTTASPLAFDQGSGAWKGTFPLDPGTYQYKFVIDGTTWVADPKNPDTVDDGFCGFNSQLSIGCDGVEAPQGVHGNGCPPAGGASSGGASGEGGSD
jgi:hypothetical protein